MKVICLFILQLFMLVSLNAQTETPGVSAANKKDTVVARVEMESTFPGGAPGWARFLQDNLEYPKKAIKKNVQGTVVTRFIVDKDGVISDIEAVNGPELLREAAVDVIKKSPNWKPAFQNGKKVKSYKIQPITFKLEQAN